MWCSSFSGVKNRANSGRAMRRELYNTISTCWVGNKWPGHHFQTSACSQEHHQLVKQGKKVFFHSTFFFFIYIFLLQPWYTYIFFLLCCSVVSFTFLLRFCSEKNHSKWSPKVSLSSPIILSVFSKHAFSVSPP